MRVLVAAASHASAISGIQRHAINLVRCLASRAEITAIDIVISPWQEDIFRSAQQQGGARLTLHIAPTGASAIDRNLWHYYALPKLAKRLHSDIVHFSYPVPTNKSAFDCPVIVTLHDLYPVEIPQNFRLSKVTFNRLVLKQCLKAVDAIACVSDATLDHLRNYMTKRIWQKATRIFNCVENEVFPSMTSPVRGWNGEPFLLCVAQHRRNKNIPLLLRVFRRLLLGDFVASSMKLVIVGIPGPETEMIHRTVEELGLSHKVHFLQGITERELQWCYCRCSALVIPSITEGFGLPVAEGLLAGCRVVCSDIPALREVGGSHCSFVRLEPNSEMDFAQAIARSLRQDPPGPIPMPHLSVSHLSAEYIALYAKLLAPRLEPNPGFGGPAGILSMNSAGNRELKEVRRGRV